MESGGWWPGVAANGGSRRTVLRAGVGTLALALGLVGLGADGDGGQDRAASKQKKKKTKRDREDRLRGPLQVAPGSYGLPVSQTPVGTGVVAVA